MKIDPSHPRAFSLRVREKLVWGVKKGLVHPAGLTAHGRGEAFDYLFGEKTNFFAQKAVKAAAALLLLAKKPVISVNGNTAVLVPKELVKLSLLLNAPLEVNLFHPSKKREEKIALYLQKFGAKKILLAKDGEIPGVKSHRRKVSPEGQIAADVVFIPLEDGDRTEALLSLGKKVVAVDLNPLSRTARKATITLIDDVVRILPFLLQEIKSGQKISRQKLWEILQKYDNQKILAQALLFLSQRLKALSQKELLML